MLMWMRLLLLLLLCFGFGFATEEEERRYLAMPCHAMPCYAMLCYAMPCLLGRSSLYQGRRAAHYCDGGEKSRRNWGNTTRVCFFVLGLLPQEEVMMPFAGFDGSTVREVVRRHHGDWVVCELVGGGG